MMSSYHAYVIDNGCRQHLKFQQMVRDKFIAKRTAEVLKASSNAAALLGSTAMVVV